MLLPIASSMKSGCDDAPPPPPIGKNPGKKGGRRASELNRKNSKRSQLAKKDSPVDDRVIAIDSNPPDKVEIDGNVSVYSCFCFCLNKTHKWDMF